MQNSLFIMTTVADTIDGQVLMKQEVQESRDVVVCILCLSSFMNSTTIPHPGSDVETSFGWKKKVFELTKLNAAYLHLYENRYSFCNECQKQICLLEELSISFESIRDQFKCVSTAICRAVLEANIKMGKNVPELTSDEFQGWNARRMKEMLSEKNSEFQDGEVADDVVMLHYDADLNENVEIPDIFVSQLYDDFQLPIEIENDFILTNNQLSDVCENVAIKIESCDQTFPVSGNVITDNDNDAVNTSISTVHIPEMTDNDSVTLLDANSDYSFLQFQGLTVAINATEDTTDLSTLSQPILPLPFQKFDENASKIEGVNVSGSSPVVSSKVFKCPTCDASYTRKYRLSHHIKTRHSIKTDDSPDIPKKQIKCLQCPKTFTRPYSLKQHVKNIHERDGNACDKCNRSFSTAKLLEIHKTKHGNPTFECPICKKLLFYKKSFKIHLNSHYTNTFSAPVVTCEKCGISNDSPALIISHMESHTEDYVCSDPSCGNTFKSAELLEIHVKQHHSNYKKQLHPCTFCSSTFEDENLLEGHIMANHNSGSFLCDECGEAFDSKNLLTAHSKSHKKPTEYKCDICAKVLHKKWNFKTHMMLHSGVKPYKCPECPLSFVQKTLLTSHIRRKHKGELPYKCPNCSHPGFSYQVGLRKHLSTDHSEIYMEFKKFLCDICWKTFSKEDDLSKHSKIHEKHKCKLCHRQFRMLEHLKEHLLRHANMKLFPCPYCDESFLRKTFAVHHIKKVHPDRDAEYDVDADHSTYILTIST